MAAFTAQAVRVAGSSRDTNLLNGHHPLCNLTPLSSCKTLSTTNPFNSISYTYSISFRRAPLLHIRASSQANAAAERTFVMIKPDGVQRGLVGDIISRFERKGFILKGLKLFQCPTDLAQVHYQELKEKPFYPKLVKYITSGPVVCMAWEGQGVVASARKLIGVTNPLQAEPGTIRGDFAVETGRNVIHGSDSPQNGEREIGLWFNEEELCQWSQTLTPWLHE